MSDNSLEKWVTLKELQEYLGVGRETILAWISKRNMPAYKGADFGSSRFPEVDEWVHSGAAADKQDSSNDKEDKSNGEGN